MFNFTNYYATAGAAPHQPLVKSESKTIDFKLCFIIILFCLIYFLDAIFFVFFFLYENGRKDLIVFTSGVSYYLEKLIPPPAPTSLKIIYFPKMFGKKKLSLLAEFEIKLLLGKKVSIRMENLLFAAP